MKKIIVWLILPTLMALLIVLCASPARSADMQDIKQESSHAAFNFETLQVKHIEDSRTRLQVKQSIKQEKSWFNINIIRIIVVKD